jgi:hypothetical protein
MSGRTDRPDRPEIVAAKRGGDASVGMDDEGDPAHASLAEAIHWKGIYNEVVGLETAVLEQARGLMVGMTPTARHEFELTSVPVFVSQLARFRSRLTVWELRLDTHPDLA